jgi:hypothetical protein
MLHTLGFVVVGVVAVQAVPSPVQGAGPAPFTAVAPLPATSRSTEAFRPEPLSRGKPVRLLRQLFSFVPSSPPIETSNPEISPLRNRRTGVTCSMRILAIKPVPDEAMVVPYKTPPDPIVRNSSSPCVE